MYPISNRCISLALQRVGSESQDRPHDSLGKTTGSFFAPLLTSLSLCGVKIQSCILRSGQTAAGVQHLCCDGGEWMRERVRAAPTRKPLDPNNQNMVSYFQCVQIETLSNNMLFLSVCSILYKIEKLSALYFIAYCLRYILLFTG